MSFIDLALTEAQKFAAELKENGINISIETKEQHEPFYTVWITLRNKSDETKSVIYDAYSFTKSDGEFHLPFLDSKTKETFTVNLG